MKAKLYWVVEFLRSAAPRTLSAKDTRRPLLVFTDAALEGNESIATIGGVMFDGASCKFSRLNYLFYSLQACKPIADM